MQTATFTFAGIPGFVTRSIADTFVRWGGMAFQIETAKPELRAAIEAALTKAAQVEADKNRQALLRGMSRAARKASYGI
jgi:hypothetical protein